MPLIGSTITPIVVFLPLIAITGVTGAFFRALAITVGMALLTSLGLALTWTPTLSHYFLRRTRDEPRTTNRERREPRRLGAAAAHAALRARARDWRSRGRAARGRERARHGRRAYGGYRLLGSDLLPEMDEGGFILDYIMPAGSSLDGNQPRADRRSRRFCATRRKSKARRAAPACSSAWRR